MDEKTLVAKCREMAKLKAKWEVQDEKTKAIKREYDKMREETVPEMMDEIGITTIKIAKLGRVSVTADLRASVKKGCQPEVKKWLEANDCEDIVSETINSSTLKAFIKLRIKEGESVPDELMNIHPYSRATITKS